jgi:hypothetical protein
MNPYLFPLYFACHGFGTLNNAFNVGCNASSEVYFGLCLCSATDPENDFVPSK